MLATARDYGDSGLTIRTAMLDHAKAYPDKEERPEYTLWHGLYVKTSDVFAVPKKSIVHAEFLAANRDIEQGFDIKLDDGWLELEQGERVPHLRTWKDERFEGIVEYPFSSRDGRLWVWNIYKMNYRGGQIVEEKWTENAGFWVERVSENERIYHCSHGMAPPPDFGSLVFKIRVSSS